MIKNGGNLCYKLDFQHPRVQPQLATVFDEIIAVCWAPIFSSATFLKCTVVLVFDGYQLTKRS